jgi:hypothetical protein
VIPFIEIDCSFTATSDKVTIYTSDSVSKNSSVSLTCGSMILIALLRSGDYNPVTRFFFEINPLKTGLPAFSL